MPRRPPVLRLRPDALVIALAKGLDPATHRLLTDVIVDATGHDPSRVAPLSGPNHAEEIAAGQPAASVIASSDRGRRARPAAGALDRALPRLRVGGRARRAALRRRQERDRDRRGHLRRPRLRRQRARGADHARPGRDDAPGLGARRRRRAPTRAWPAWATSWRPAPRATRATAPPASCWRAAFAPAAAEARGRHGRRGPAHGAGAGRAGARGGRRAADHRRRLQHHRRGVHPGRARRSCSRARCLPGSSRRSRQAAAARCTTGAAPTTRESASSTSGSKTLPAALARGS